MGGGSMKVSQPGMRGMLMKLDLNWKPKTIGEQVVFYSLCLLLLSPILLHSRMLFDAMTAVAAVIVVGVAGLVFTGRGSC
jgi:hypothetical protein